jgi:hypothetical protein
VVGAAVWVGRVGCADVVGATLVDEGDAVALPPVGVARGRALLDDVADAVVVAEAVVVVAVRGVVSVPVPDDDVETCPRSPRVVPVDEDWVTIADTGFWPISSTPVMTPIATTKTAAA